MVKRPPVGIWGGLWSLPEFETETQCLKFIEKNNLALQKNLCSVDPLLHKFSHYELQLKPLVLSVSKNKQTQSINELDEITWFELDNIPKGIATPINKLINRCLK
jgi:A/G-specific adenine glycosylase